MMKKSMDDDILRQKIIALLKESGSSSSDSDLNNAVMNMLKILPPPVVKLKAEKSLPVSSCLLEHDIPYPQPEKYDFTFIDLFAGIGGFRLAFQKAGGRSVFSSEWDEAAQKTYEANYGEIPVGDIRAVDKDAIPDHDVLCAGFPCQPFSLAGVSKRIPWAVQQVLRIRPKGHCFLKSRKYWQKNVRLLLCLKMSKISFATIRDGLLK